MSNAGSNVGNNVPDPKSKYLSSEDGVNRNPYGLVSGQFILQDKPVFHLLLEKVPGFAHNRANAYTMQLYSVHDNTFVDTPAALLKLHLRQHSVPFSTCSSGRLCCRYAQLSFLTRLFRFSQP